LAEKTKKWVNGREKGEDLPTIPMENSLGRERRGGLPFFFRAKKKKIMKKSKAKRSILGKVLIPYDKKRPLQNPFLETGRERVVCGGGWQKKNFPSSEGRSILYGS